MLLFSGSGLGPNEIVAPIGAGGMGEVYRAAHSRLGRDVAIKILTRAPFAEPAIARPLCSRDQNTGDALAPQPPGNL
jgi:serine/threonine protein kinase